MEGADASMSKVASSPFFSSGSAKMDRLLGGGYRAGTLTEIFGRSNSGKSQLAMQAALVAAKNGYRTLYLDTEGSFRPERLEQIALSRGWGVEGLLEMVTYARSHSAGEQMEAVRRMQGREATARCRLVVIDTLTRNFSVELPGRANMASRQEALDVHLSETARDAYINGRAYILTNRVTFGPTHDVSIGGRTVEQMVGVSVRLDRQGAKVRGTRTDSREYMEAELTEGGVE